VFLLFIFDPYVYIGMVFDLTHEKNGGNKIGNENDMPLMWSW